MIELTRFTKKDGPLTKRISLDPHGKLVSDGSACVMSRGTARRMRFRDLYGFAETIGSLNQNEAVALGALRVDLPDAVDITTKRKLEELNGTAQPTIIARTSTYIAYRPKQPALALLDFDTKGMPAEVAARLNDLGGYWPALVSVLPKLGTVAHVLRRSTSTGLFRTDTGEKLPGSRGLHVFLVLKDGTDVERFLTALHARCWLAGLGWMMVGAGGQLLERSIVDRMVGASERLVFEGAPVLDPPLAQNHESRKPNVMEGEPLDSAAACPPLRILENARLRELRAKEAHRLAPESAQARQAFIGEQSKRLIARTGISLDAAAKVVERQCGGILLPNVVLLFDDPELAGITVADVLADPARFDGATLADPLEGVEYGMCKAKIMRRADGTPWIHSFAHGRTTYELKLDASAVKAALEKAPAADVADTFVREALTADLDDDELEDLRNYAAQRTGSGKRAIDRKFKSAKQERDGRRAEEERSRRAAERRDPRPQIPAPAPDAPWLPQMGVLNDVLGALTDFEPPMRDLAGVVTQVHVRHIPSMHLLTGRGTNEGETEESRLPSPEQPLLTRLDEPQLAEMIERHIDYTDANGRPVHLQGPFVKHFLCRHDGALPVVTAVATLPMVLPDGTILSGRGLDRQRGVVFRVPDELQTLLPQLRDCTATAVAKAMQLLTDDWLCDVATDYAGKCIIIASALTILERLLLPERPAFFNTAGQRGSGKTTLANMVAIAALGRRAAAAAWSSSDEERRKALLAYLGEGVPLIVWDNIPRGAAISCPSIEKALTAETYTDRVLGESENRTVPATAVHIFTGNNIAARGDLASRSLSVRLAVDRPDPENRTFAHPDPLGWTEANRGSILRALYLILLGNPRLRDRNPPPAETRFKTWWHLVGSAIEHAAELHVKDTAERIAAMVADPPTCPPVGISFRKLFLNGEADEEQTSSLATVIDVLRHRWSAAFKASDVALFAGQASEEAIEFKAALEQASGKAIKVVTPTSITWRLKAVTDAPVLVGGKVMALRYMTDKSGHGGDYQVKEIGS